MAHLQQLNTSFISILYDPFNMDAWGDFDVSCIYLNHAGFRFEEQKKELSCTYKISIFPKIRQLDFIEIELTKSVEQQFYQYSKQILNYRKNVLKKWWKVKKLKIKAFKTNYFVEKDNVVYFRLSGHPLLDLKFMRIIKRRCELTCENNKKN